MDYANARELQNKLMNNINISISYKQKRINRINMVITNTAISYRYNKHIRLFYESITNNHY